MRAVCYVVGTGGVMSLRLELLDSFGCPFYLFIYFN